jgi:hypothetical protein
MEITDSSLPAGWEFSYIGGGHLSLLIGYSLLLHSESHFDGILERNEVELDKFAEMKAAIEIT